jgi:hypothetical protein
VETYSAINLGLKFHLGGHGAMWRHLTVVVYSLKLLRPERVNRVVLGHHLRLLVELRLQFVSTSLRDCLFSVLSNHLLLLC